MPPSHHYQRRQLAREAAWLEIQRDYADAARLWALVSRRAPKPQWQAFASQRATLCQPDRSH
ncbi:ANR family transcriptional regulator [Klebsiella aerogenes]|uniref:ANR family transcriptional regulator n=1 Tax=Klebsiella aerogenes TaxID=548 RepID=A0AAP9U7W5_KLEAE|nr:ANR family transcriptional regulator [Klebsiella aerogenes]QMR42979.1 ANR family transcriptional regulator [Klebsiella aerogenes]